nr:MAG TPA: hypothetical protein [Microviridae sp.]
MISNPRPIATGVFVCFVLSTNSLALPVYTSALPLRTAE